MTERIGWIGLGVMGLPMAGHVLKKSGSLCVWNRTPEKAKSLAEAGAQLAESPAQLARQCSVICICVSDTPDVEQVAVGTDGIAEGVSPGSLVIDFSTISANTTRQLAVDFREKDVDWVDAPLSGGDAGARNAALTIMAGGTREAFNRAEPIFEYVGKSINYMGESGSGQMTKLVNQVAVVGSIAAMSEALVFARRLGIEPERVLDVLKGGAAGSWSLDNYGPRLLKGNYQPGFAARLQAKDLRLVQEAAQSADAELPVTKLMSRLYERMEREGLGGEGNHAVAKLFGWE